MADIKLIVDTKSVDRAIDKIDRLRTGVGRTSKTTKRYTSTVEQASRANIRHSQSTKEVRNQYVRMNAATFKAQQSTKRFASVGLQQAGYQVGDFIVQVQNGQSALVAFGQQGSQLAGIFGPMGAIVGALIAAGTAVYMIIKATQDAAKAAKALETLRKEISGIMDRLSSFQDTKASVGDLTEFINRKFSESRDVVQELAKDLIRLERFKISEKLADSFSGFLNIVNESSARLSQLQRQREGLERRLSRVPADTESADRINRLLSDVKKEIEGIGASSNELNNIFIQFQSIIRETDPKKMVVGFAQLKSDAEQIGGPIGRQVVKAIEEAAREAGVLGMLSEKITFSGAVESAQKLADKLGISLELARKLEGLGLGSGNKVILDPRDPNYDPIAAQMAGMDYDTTSPFDRGDKDKGGGGGGGGSAINEREKMLESVNRLISSYDKEYAKALKVEEATKLIAKAQRIGAIPANMEADQVLQDYIDSLEDAKNPMADFVNNAAKQMSSAFMSIVDGSKSASDAFKDMARSILKQAFELAVINPIINSIFGGASGFTKLPTLANGAAFSNGKVTAFANGGVVNQPTMFPMANGAGLMGEAGPEAIMPLKRGKNGKLGVQVEDGGQQPVVINQSFNFSANGDESVKRIIAQEAPRIANLTQKQILDQRRRGGVMKSTFG